ncbi:MAG: tRNA uridine-5-carboxymethylaminomethyl(34) synthesis GTPase MnmE [Firmicutes bacterium HGW-Firmicutes-20]|jgi:tRNA modification GTPase|nr:MAG: tRNA uridine-5-carboxymethylaminomethyl(34) synthesis GTPase MnmE [Firmicutes bacterium HGW-Firmicutes-20]PKM88118.1 MAG: tRNA uridine-5-carboxymethylaminomethyl(34) synthesis GTPase MnmE [Firmicutes bacterium HGW-Firmicutes-10]
MEILDTIAAISTANQESAISMVRISGSDAIQIADVLFSKSVKDQKSHTMQYGFIKDPQTGSIVDEVLLSLFRAPKTYTTEDIVEINCHGGIIVTQRILALILSLGARLANPGEFTQRAYIYGRIDLTQAESVIDLIQAHSEQSASLAIAGVRGSISKLLQPLLDDLLSIIAHIEVNIDYPEYEDIVQLTEQDIYPKTKKWLNDLKTIIDRFKSGKIVREGVKTVILGKPNVGKSSLLNALLEEEKAIVTEVAGTTRDLVEGWIRLKNVTLHLIDTAGLRDTEDRVEMIGINKTKQAMQEADLVILVLDASADEDEYDHQLLDLTKDKSRIIVYNKSDIKKMDDGLYISALNQDIGPLVDAIEELFAHHQVALKEPTLSNQRQIGLAMAAYQSMESAISAIESGLEVDVITIDLQAAYESLKAILNNQNQPKLLDEIFGRFCLGK